MKKYIPLQNFPSKSGSSIYTVSIDFVKTEEEKQINLSCNCKGWIFSEKRNQEKGINHKTCRHTNTTSILMEERYNDHLLKDIVALDAIKHEHLDYTVSDLFGYNLDGNGKFLKGPRTRREKIPVVSECPRCHEENVSDKDIVECKNCNCEYCE